MFFNSLLLVNIRMKKRTFTLGIMIFIQFHIASANGLLMQGNLEKMEQRTSYRVFKEGTIPIFQNRMEMNFEIMIKEFDTFGYIFQIIDESSKSICNFTYTYIDDTHSSFKFNTEGKATHASFIFNIDSINRRWLPVSLHFDLLANDVIVTVAGKTCKSNGKINFSKSLRPDICFGRREHIIDLPNFAIRNLVIKGENQSYTFLLNESAGEDVHDIKGGIYGYVKNPKWMINDAYHWNELFISSSASPCTMNYSESEQKIYFANQDSLYYYDLRSGHFGGNKYANKLPMNINLGTSFLDEKNRNIYIYEVNGQSTDVTSIAVLDLKTNTWKSISKTNLPMQLHHHVGYLNQKENKYMIFGGFGNRKYNGNFLSYEIEKDKWDTLSFKGDVIPPRFFSSLALSKDSSQLYIYGGVGNESGDQSLGRYYYNDLYRVNIKEHRIEKCWNKESKEGNQSAVGDMFLSDDERYLYIIRYPEYEANSFLKLYRFSVFDGESVQLGDSIPIISEEIKTNASLLYNPKLETCYCVKLEYYNATTVRISVYGLSTPPVSRTDIDFYIQKANQDKIFGWIIGGVIFIVVGICFFFIYYYKQKNISFTEKEENITDFFLDEKIKPSKSVKEILANKRNMIYLYGLFAVYDRYGRDITYMFSKKIKEIFLYILLNSTDKGIMSSSLNELFWPDKPDDKIKNLKGVTTNHLRKILAELDGVELIYEKGYFRVMVSEPCHCDYLSSCFLLHREDSINELINLWGRGNLLEDMRMDIFDIHKRKIEDSLFSVLSIELSKRYKAKNYEGVLVICHILRKNDPLNESALLYSVHTYQKRNQPEEASKRYMYFAKEYQRTMGEFYSRSLNSLLTEE